jgi:hypothetical protein
MLMFEISLFPGAHIFKSADEHRALEKIGLRRTEDAQQRHERRAVDNPRNASSLPSRLSTHTHAPALMLRTGSHARAFKLIRNSA